MLTRVARRSERSERNSCLLILADALEEAGFDNPYILTQLRTDPYVVYLDVLYLILVQPKCRRRPKCIGTLNGAKFNGKTFDAWVTNKLEWDVSDEASFGAYIFLWRNIRPVGMDRTTIQKACGMLTDARQRLGGRISFEDEARTPR